ncbi:MAG: hypothetical protein QOJ47_2235, partial [Gaiellales bacterium]|nr:hypothetical protein [Gaiellales bacterium]
MPSRQIVPGVPRLVDLGQRGLDRVTDAARGGLRRTVRAAIGLLDHAIGDAKL